MRPYDYSENDDLPDEEQVVDDVMGENPRARDLRLMRAALEQRRDHFRREQTRLDAANPEQAKLKTKLAELERQIAAIHQEEAISAFVESSVRVTLNNADAQD